MGLIGYQKKSGIRRIQTNIRPRSDACPDAVKIHLYIGVDFLQQFEDLSGILNLGVSPSRSQSEVWFLKFLRSNRHRTTPSNHRREGAKLEV
jgi:hypothetical protein